MPYAPASKHDCGRISPERLAVIDCLLTEAIKIGAASKHRAIDKVLRDFPEFTRGDCWQRIRHLRRTADRSNLRVHQQCARSRSTNSEAGQRTLRRWTEADDDKLLNWAGYEDVEKIARRLNRSERAIRFRLSALGMSAKVSDGWSMRALRKMLRVSPDRLRRLMASGMLRVSDARVTAHSLVRFCEQNHASLDPAAVARVGIAVSKARDAYPWKQAADLFGVPVAQVQCWVADGQLKMTDTFVTDRCFEEFCKKHGAEINTALIDPATTTWLIQEYGVPAPSADRGTVPRAQKHALVVRTCKCGKTIAGNVFFRHVKTCKVAARRSMRAPAYELNPAGSTVGDSTKESALARHSSNGGYGSGSREPPAPSQ